MSKMSKKRREKGEGSILSRGENKWLLKYDLPRGSDGKRRTRYKTVKGSKADARRELRELLRSIDRGEHVDATRMTFSQFFDTWLGSYVKPRVTPRTLQGYRELIEWYVTPTLSAVLLQKITPTDLRKLFAGLAESGARKPDKDGNPRGLSPVSLASIRRTLAVLFNDAVKDQLITRNPLTDVKIAAPKSTKSERALDFPSYWRSDGPT